MGTSGPGRACISESVCLCAVQAILNQVQHDRPRLTKPVPVQTVALGLGRFRGVLLLRLV